jgi:hypothetical protein
MEPSKVEEILKQAAEAVEGLPTALQAKAFELAVTMLTGQVQPLLARVPPGPSTNRPNAQNIATIRDRELQEVSDLLPLCKRNPDRYLVFLRDLEAAAGEPPSTSAISERFKKYKQDTPKLPTRDLADMVAKGLIEQVGKGRDATFVLKRKGRERLAELDAALSAN